MIMELHDALPNKEFQITDDLFKLQDTLLDLMLELSDFLEEDKVLRN